MCLQRNFSKLYEKQYIFLYLAEFFSLELKTYSMLCLYCLQFCNGVDEMGEHIWRSHI